MTNDNPIDAARDERRQAAAIEQFIRRLAASQEPLPPDIAEIIDDHFWGMFEPIGDEK